MSLPKQLNFSNSSLSAAAVLSANNNSFLLGTAGTYTLPALNSVIDGTMLILKHTGATGSIICVPAGSDTIDGGIAANVTLTSSGAGLGQSSTILAVKQSGSSTWWRIVKAQ